MCSFSNSTFFTFLNVCFASLFPPFDHPLSTCSLFLTLRVFFAFFAISNFFYSCYWIVSSFTPSMTFLHKFLNLCKLLLNFLFFFYHQKNLVVCFFFLLDMFYIYFSCFVLCFCVLKNGLQFSYCLLACCDVSEKMLLFIQQIGDDIFCFSLCHVCFFYCSLVCFFLLKRVCEIILFNFELFFEIPYSSFFLPSLFSHEKFSIPKKSSLFFQSFLCFTFFLSTFFLFLSLLFSVMFYRPFVCFISFLFSEKIFPKKKNSLS